MLRQLFPRGYVRYEHSRFVQDLEDFGAWLEATGYSRECIRGHLFRVCDLLARFAHVNPRATHTVAQLRAVFRTERVRTRRSMLYRSTQRAYENFLVSQGRLAVVPEQVQFPELRRRYRQELLNERGLSNETVEQHERTISDFLSRTLSAGQSLDVLTSADVDRYLLLKGKTVGLRRLQHIVAHLRAFFRFCQVNELIHLPLAVIDTVRVHCDELPPRALQWSLVRELLRSIDRSSRSGWRDYAILHLMSHYGVRPSEIVSLRMDSIDWNGRVLKVEQHKTRSTLMLPLADRTTSLLRRYLQQGRPRSPHPQLFLRARCPTGSLTRHAVADVFEKRAARSGLSIEGYSVYSLRHAFAMRLLERGVGLKTIGDLLGHRHLGSTCQYLRLDIDMLREVALPVPLQALV